MELFFLRGYDLFRKGDGGICLYNYVSIMRPPGYGKFWAIFSKPRRYLIDVNRNCSREEQIRTVIHELLHIGLEHDDLLFYMD